MIFVPFKFGKISHPNLISVRFHNLSRLLFFCSRNNRYKVGFTDGEERELEITAILSPSMPSVSSGTTCAKLTHRIQFVFCAYWKLKDNNRAWNESLKRNESKYNLVYLPGRISSKKYLHRKQHWTHINAVHGDREWLNSSLTTLRRPGKQRAFARRDLLVN